MSPSFTCCEKLDAKKRRSPSCPERADLHCVQVALLEVKSVGDHQFDPGLLRGADHGLALFLGDRHGLFAQDVHTCAGRTLGVLAVHAVGQTDVDRVDIPAGQQPVVLLIRTSLLDLVLLAQHAQLLGVIRDQRSELRVFVGMLESRQKRRLRDVPQPHHRVPDLSALYVLWPSPTSTGVRAVIHTQCSRSAFAQAPPQRIAEPQSQENIIHDDRILTRPQSVSRRRHLNRLASFAHSCWATAP